MARTTTAVAGSDSHRSGYRAGDCHTALITDRARAAGKRVSHHRLVRCSADFCRLVISVDMAKYPADTAMDTLPGAGFYSTRRNCPGLVYKWPCFFHNPKPFPGSNLANNLAIYGHSDNI